ncbi:MAG: hypothetical protein NTW19_01860 [Planctomycetota bacterium]|nr:hypothetical protein [Planctomycetota bacterium]
MTIESDLLPGRTPHEANIGRAWPAFAAGRIGALMAASVVVGLWNERVLGKWGAAAGAATGMTDAFLVFLMLFAGGFALGGFDGLGFIAGLGLGCRRELPAPQLRALSVTIGALSLPAIYLAGLFWAAAVGHKTVIGAMLLGLFSSAAAVGGATALVSRLLSNKGWMQLPPEGACQSCGYDLRGSPAEGECPECGAERAAARG